MYIWKIEALKEEIIDDSLSEKDRFIYALIYVTLCALALEVIEHMPAENPNIWDLIDSIANILVTFLGTLFAFNANGGSSGTDFLGRFFSISFVVGIRFLVILIPLMMFLGFYYFYAFAEDEEIVSTPIDVLPFLIWYALMYWRICKHIGDVKNS